MTIVKAVDLLVIKYNKSMKLNIRFIPITLVGTLHWASNHTLNKLRPCYPIIMLTPKDRSYLLVQTMMLTVSSLEHQSWSLIHGYVNGSVKASIRSCKNQISDVEEEHS